MAGWLKDTFPGDEAMHVSHETIYRSLFILARGVPEGAARASAGAPTYATQQARDDGGADPRADHRCGVDCRSSRHGGRCNLEAERVLIDALLESIRDGHIHSAHDCADGGLGVALAECVMMDRARPTGADIALSAWSALPTRALLFGEAQARVVVSTGNAKAVLATTRQHGVPATIIGTVRCAAGRLDITIGETRLTSQVSQLADAYHEAIPRIMQRSASAQDVALASDSVV